jgi:hypothetical protein
MQRLDGLSCLQVVRHFYKPEPLGLSGAGLFDDVTRANLAKWKKQLEQFLFS